MTRTSRVNATKPAARGRQPRRAPRRSEDTQIVRALALLLAMTRSRRGVHIRQFAEERGYPVSAVYRDRDLLRRVGVPIDGPVEGSRYRLADAWLPPAATGATREEMLSLFVARHLAPGLRGTRVARHLDALWAKLAGPAGQPPLTFLEDAGLSVPAQAAIDYGPHSVVIDLLATGRRERKVVWIRYRRPDGAETERLIEPGLLHWDGRLEALYVPSWCRLREAVRVFAVHRILDAQLTDESYAPRAATRRAALARAFQIWMGEHVEAVTIQFSARVAGEIRERRRHASQRLEERAGGEVVLHLEVAEPDELTRWILGYGADARVLRPAALAARVQQRHAEAAAVPVSVAPVDDRVAQPRAAPRAQPSVQVAAATAGRRSKP